MISYFKINNINFVNPPEDCETSDLEGIMVSHLVCSLPVTDTCKLIDEYLSTQPLHKIIFDFQSEGFQQEIIHYMNDVVKKLVTEYNGYTKDMFYYYTGAIPIQSNVDSYNSFMFDFLPENILLANNCARPYFNNRINRQLEINTKPKNFLSMNGVPRTNRRIALSWLIKNNLLDKAFYSFDSTNLMKNDNNNPLLQKYNAITGDLDSIFSGIQTMILSKNHANYSIDDRIMEEDVYYFDNSYFSLVQETFYDNTLDWSTDDIAFYESILVSEKTYRPIYFKHPFITLGVKGSLAGLREYGFKTFSPYFDESYDEIDDPVLRIEIALNEVKRLCSLSDEEWLSIQRDLLPILEYNYNLLTSDSIKFLLGKRK
jgi:hypothetical protein